MREVMTEGEKTELRVLRQLAATHSFPQPALQRLQYLIAKQKEAKERGEQTCEKQ